MDRHNLAAAFVKMVSDHATPENVINPWKDYVDGYDIGPQAVEIRRDHLLRYLTPRTCVARFILIAEAVGYQGARFSGVPLTSERMVTGNHPFVKPPMIFGGGPGVRTSLPNLPKLNRMQAAYGFSEPTASIVWKAVLASGQWAPTDFIFWNIYPFHPFKSRQDMMTNRTPTSAELSVGMRVAKELFNLSPGAEIVAIGRKAAETLMLHHVNHLSVPHPANGRANLFRSALKNILDSAAGR